MKPPGDITPMIKTEVLKHMPLTNSESTTEPTSPHPNISSVSHEFSAHPEPERIEPHPVHHNTESRPTCAHHITKMPRVAMMLLRRSCPRTPHVVSRPRIPNSHNQAVDRRESLQGSPDMKAKMPLSLVTSRGIGTQRSLWRRSSRGTGLSEPKQRPHVFHAHRTFPRAPSRVWSPRSSVRTNLARSPQARDLLAHIPRIVCREPSLNRPPLLNSLRLYRAVRMLGIPGDSN